MYKIIGFLSRPHGFSVLNELIDNPNYDVIKIFTHKLKPKTEDPERGVRDDYHLFSKLCNKHNIELTPIDSKNDTINILDCDVIVEVSWRFLISSDIVKKAKILAFGIHRGKLPDYPGREPIKQAISNGDKEIILSAHLLAPEIDGGNVIDEISYEVNYDKHRDLEENIQNIRDGITPLFPILMNKVINKFTSKKN